MNKLHSWVNFFALSLSSSKPIISFAKNNECLNKMPFFYLIQYYKSKPSTNIAKIQKVSKVLSTNLESKSQRKNYAT